MVLGEEDVVGIARVDESLPEVLDLALEEVGLQELMR